MYRCVRGVGLEVGVCGNGVYVQEEVQVLRGSAHQQNEPIMYRLV